MLTDVQILGTRMHATAVAKQLSLRGLRQMVLDTETAALGAGQNAERAELEIMLAVYRDEMTRREKQQSG